MKILITGGAGFIGSAVTRLAISRGNNVLNVDALTYAACLDNLKDISCSPLYSFIKYDIRDRSGLDKIFDDYRPDCVMHLAAESHVDRSIIEPATFIETNILGTFNLLEASLNYWNSQGSPKSFRFHHISTDEVFGSLPMDPTLKFSETSRYDPRSPYSASKASSDHLVRAWHETYGLPTVLSNCSNNYGPYHFPEKLIPVIILNAIRNQPIPIYGNGSNIRDWLFVEDHADALLQILERAAVGSNYNIGGNNELSNLTLAQTICGILDQLRPLQNTSYSELITFVTDRPGHDMRYAIDSSRIMKDLNWRPLTTLEDGLRTTITWYLENEQWWLPLLKIAGGNQEAR